MTVPDIAMANRIIFENDACMVINKIPGESSELGETVQTGGKPKFPLPVHRLDVPVSGCILFAKTQEAAAFLSAAFARRDKRVTKTYWAIVEMPSQGTAFQGEASLVHWLYEDRKLNKAFAEPWKEGKPPLKARLPPPRKAVLRYRVTGQGERYLFMEINLITGRHHQIRAQLAALGIHVKGDLKYGARRSEKNGGIRLHAYSLTFPDPLNPGSVIEANALPPELDPLWTACKDSVLQGKNTG
ncbi:MAG: RNA pseudouridine synthase [Treponema sp.]|nr:RNA pseudouridine synthase [Treponema sp.]